MTATLRDYYSAADTEVGEMVEGYYGWNEHCPRHAVAVLNINPERKHRSIDIFEVCTASREYRCYVCRKLLWDRTPKDPVAPTPRTAHGSTVVVFPKKEDA